jgi:hypothetical protein
MIGRFKDADTAKHIRVILDELRDQVQHEQASGLLTEGVPPDRYSTRMNDLLVRLGIHTIQPQELEQFNYEFELSIDNNSVVLKTDETDISAALKVMIGKGAKVEVYSAHDH